MTVLLIILAGVATSLAVVVLGLKKRADSLAFKLRRAEPYIIRSGADIDEVDILFEEDEWVLHDKGGNTNTGRTKNFGLCPCQSEWTCKTVTTPINAWPNPGQVAACAANPPLAAAPTWTCADDCVQVMTHIWRGWHVFRNVNNGQFKFQCHTMAQYHCKKPDDPARWLPPKETDPGAPEA